MEKDETRLKNGSEISCKYL